MLKKQFFTILLLGALTASCVTTRQTRVPNASNLTADSERIEILGQVSGEANGTRVWLTFIPLGWANDNWMRMKARDRALNQFSEADGIIDEVENYRKTTYPFLLVFPQKKKLEIKGTAYRIRTSAEIDERRRKQEDEKNRSERENRGR